MADGYAPTRSGVSQMLKSRVGDREQTVYPREGQRSSPRRQRAGPRREPGQRPDPGRFRGRRPIRSYFNQGRGDERRSPRGRVASGRTPDVVSEQTDERTAAVRPAPDLLGGFSGRYNAANPYGGAPVAPPPEPPPEAAPIASRGRVGGYAAYEPPGALQESIDPGFSAASALPPGYQTEPGQGEYGVQRQQYAPPEMYGGFYPQNPYGFYGGRY